MNINHLIDLNLSENGIPPRLSMPQGDANSRTVVATLWDGSQPYTVPDGAAVMVRFRKPDGTGGLYDTTEGGLPVTVSGGTVTAPVASQMLAVAGTVFAELDLFGADTGAAAAKLATFRFVVDCTPCVYPDAQIISSDYYNVLTAKIAEAVEAASASKYWAEKAQQAAGAGVTVSATLAASGWSGSAAPYTYALTVNGVTTTSYQEIVPALNITAAQLAALQAANIQDGGQAVNTVTLKAFGTKPTIDLPIRVIKRGD